MRLFFAGLLFVASFIQITAQDDGQSIYLPVGPDDKTHEGSWVYKEGMVTAYGNTEIYTTTNLHAAITDSTGEVQLKGTYLRLRLGSSAEFPYFWNAGGLKGVIYAGETKIISIPMSVSKDSPETKIKLLIRYWDRNVKKVETFFEKNKRELEFALQSYTANAKLIIEKFPSESDGRDVYRYVEALKNASWHLSYFDPKTPHPPKEPEEVKRNNLKYTNDAIAEVATLYENLNPGIKELLKANEENDTIHSPECSGEIKNGKHDGAGTHIWPTGKTYVGQFKDGKRNGQGTVITADGNKYVGQWKEDKIHGEGTYIWSNGNKYVGQFKDGKRNGQGTLTFADGNKYVGQFKEDKFHGQGTLTLSNGEKYVGQFEDSKIHGQGTYTYADGRKYVGQFKDGKRNGQGTLTFADGNKYVGQFKEDKFHGQGTYTFADGHKYVGKWKEDKFLGK